MKLKQTILAAGMLMAAAVPMQSQAATATATMNVNMTVLAPTGTLLVNGPMDFGTTVTTATGSALAQSTFTINVTNSVPYTVAIDPGLHAGTNSVFAREMLDPALPTSSGIFYSLYSDSARATTWWSGGPFGFLVSRTGTGASETLVVYGSATLGNAPLAGTFSDTVTVTLTY